MSVEWMDRDGGFHRHETTKSTDTLAMCKLIEGQGGTVVKVLKVG